MWLPWDSRSTQAAAGLPISGAALSSASSGAGDRTPLSGHTSGFSCRSRPASPRPRAECDRRVSWTRTITGMAARLGSLSIAPPCGLPTMSAIQCGGFRPRRQRLRRSPPLKCQAGGPDFRGLLRTFSSGPRSGWQARSRAQRLAFSSGQAISIRPPGPGLTINRKPCSLTIAATRLNPRPTPGVLRILSER